MAPHQNDHSRHGYDEKKRTGDSEEMKAAHPLLMTWNPPRHHSFTATQMRTLTSICDAFSPSIQTSHAAEIQERGPDMAAFYGCSASDMGVPEDIAGLLTVLLKPTLLTAIKVLLWLLSTRLGTVVLGGRASLSWRFPFCGKFPSLPRSKQETILRRWSLSVFESLRAVYKLFKMITVWAVYTKIEKDGHNRNWKAIGYCGADPEVGTRKRASSAGGVGESSLTSVVIEAHDLDLTEALKKNRAGVVTILDDLTPLTNLAEGERSAPGDVGISCDVVVVGSGSGGGVAASVLAQAGYKILVLEKGKYFATEDFSTLEGPSQMAMFEKLGSLATHDGGVNLVAGATVGGGTTINWSVCFPTPPDVLREWHDTSGLELFASARYRLAMREVWGRLGAQPHVVRENLPNGVLRAGCERLGMEVGTLARNAPVDHDCGWCTSGCPSGEKGSTSVTWLADAARSGNTVLISECEAQAVLYSKNAPGSGGVALTTYDEAQAILYSKNASGKKKQYKARGVVARVGNTGRRVFVEARAVVVASGALMTPPLLLNSGLRNPNIGKGLHLHPVVFVWGYFPEAGSGPSGTCYEGAIMTSYSPIYNQKEGSSGSSPAALLEVPSTHPGSFASFQPWTSAADFKERMARFSRTVTLCVVTRDESSGQVSVDADGTPVITYALNATDEATALEGIERGLRVLIAAGATEIGTHQQDGERFSLEGANPSVVEAYIGRVKARGVKRNRVSIGSGHHMSSCRMGSDPEQSVVDGDGESWEVEGLYVSDGSVLPSAVGVNPMVTIQTLAYCIAHSVLQSLQTQSETSAAKL